jgi:hypothetical protein
MNQFDLLGVIGSVQQRDHVLYVPYVPCVPYVPYVPYIPYVPYRPCVIKVLWCSCSSPTPPPHSCFQNEHVGFFPLKQRPMQLGRSGTIYPNDARGESIPGCSL